VYDVTRWRVSGRPGLTAREDIGAVINDIIAGIKRRQPDRDAKPGAAIVIPPGDYDLRTPSWSTSAS
jgi:inulin fructotransferase (DFA-I-forming)